MYNPGTITKHRVLVKSVCDALSGYM